MFVAFWAPTKILLVEPESACVGLCLLSIPAVAGEYAKTPGLSLKVHETQLGQKQDVFITKQRPNQGGYPVCCGPTEQHSSSGQVSNKESGFDTRIKADIHRGEKTITGFTAQINLLSEETKGIPADVTSVEIVQEPPCSLSAIVGNRSLRYHLNFPAPVTGNKKDVLITKLTGRIDVSVPMADRPEKRSPWFMFPTFLDNGEPRIWNIPFINLDSLPMLDLQQKEKLQWLNTHTSLMFSARERKMRGNNRALTSDARVNLKESLFSMYMHVSGVQGPKRFQAFGLNDQQNGGVGILVSSLPLVLIRQIAQWFSMLRFSH